MARTALPVSAPVRAGVALAFTQSDQVAGNAMPNDGSTLLIVRNATAAAQTITFRVPRLVDTDLKVSDRVVGVPAGATLLLGRFDTETYNQTDGTMSIDCSVQLGLLAIQVS